ncbi:S-adenosyl-L-methionine-dependent methyltransferase [Immersiella caudata]|uniref:tRNA (guanine(26)-N(2))-dimethyltransferase n=1 Tax=Immersiella caudata TaxID=314043 RepID=A0AA40C7N6_9PEZI|nr:S-adenosyl-L-methionine-dependent methyltransferase [Immersiella caudata]
MLRSFLSLQHISRNVNRKKINKNPLHIILRAMATEAQPITALPAAKQIISYEGIRYTTIKEGLAHILIPEASVEQNSKVRNDQGVSQVFYNPIQQFNRDLTILTLKAFGKERLEHKQLAYRSKSDKLADKKRKRKEQPTGQGEAQGGPPTKSPKILENATRITAEEGSSNNAENQLLAEEAQNAAQPAAVEAEKSTETSSGGKQETAAAAGAEQEKPGSKFTILDALSASGLRALRYAHEIPFLTSVTSNDLLKTAVDSIKLNVKHNRLESKIKVSHDDAIAHMYTLIAQELRRKDLRTGKVSKSEKYDVVDLDPYGSAAPFLDAAVQAVRDDGGLLAVTCTDSGVWASAGYAEKCYSLYGGVPVKGWYSHEGGLRIVLHAIETAAAKYGLAMEPLVSLSIDFYLRVFVRIKKSPAAVKFQGGKNMVVYNCDSGCGAWATQLLMANKEAPNKKGSGVFYKHSLAKGPTVNRSCEHCGGTMHMAGPMYAGRIHSPDFIKRILAELDDASPEVYGTTARIRGMLQTALEEFLPSPEDMEAAKSGMDLSREAELATVEPYPFYFHPATLSGMIHCTTPSEAAFKGALKGLGYRVTRSHTKPGSVKTDAPWSVIWHVMREWVRQKAPVKEENIKPGSTGYRLLGLGKKQEAEAEKSGESATEEGEKQKQEEKPAVVFDEALGREVTKVKLVRYQENPTENWGPMNRAKGK